MTFLELKAALDEAGVSPRFYSFTSDGAGEVHRIQLICGPSGDTWEVYYAERGQKTSRAVFSSQDLACKELLRRILADPLTRKQNARSPGVI